jgi:signal transduction histidine kinase
MPARRWLSVLLAGVVCLAAWQLWLTVRLLEQERNLEAQQSRERLGQIADIAVAQLAASSRDWDRALHELNGLPPTAAMQARFPASAMLAVVARDRIQIYPQQPLLYTPVLPVAQDKSTGAFAAAGKLELQDRQYDRAIAALQPLTRESATRPEALLRIARIELKANHPEAALGAYKALAGEASVSPSGTPYALLAAKARYRILIQLGRRQEASQEGESLQAGLLAGHFPLSREDFEYQWSGLEKLGIATEPPPQAALDSSSYAEFLYRQWQLAVSQGADHGRGHWESSVLVWSSSADRFAALLLPADWLATGLKMPANSAGIHWRMVGEGDAPGTGITVTRSLAEAQLGGKLEFSVPPVDSAAASSRRMLLLAGAALMLLVILGSGYVVHRAISRELQVAKLQADFVAAVSHEFRSPLTTLRTITELLAQNRITAESHRQQSYIYLDRETMRLHRLVEDLLDFGRMESGRKQYRMEAHDAFQLVRATVADFSEQAAANGFRVEADFDSGQRSAAVRVKVDQEAFGRAFRNLLDNAMKYSPDCRTVWVNGALEDQRVLISVRDRGMGIDGDEKQAIFQKFVRGQAAKDAGIKGTGIGLAMVRQICEAMGGEIRLQSEAGVGSTFTLVLPLAED